MSALFVLQFKAQEKIHIYLNICMSINLYLNHEAQTVLMNGGEGWENGVMRSRDFITLNLRRSQCSEMS